MLVETQCSEELYNIHYGLGMEICIYKLSKYFVEQVSCKSGVERVKRWSLLYDEG